MGLHVGSGFDHLTVANDDPTEHRPCPHSNRFPEEARTDDASRTNMGPAHQEGPLDPASIIDEHLGFDDAGMTGTFDNGIRVNPRRGCRRWHPRSAP